MIYLGGYSEIKKMHEQRVARSLTKYRLTRTTPIDSFSSPDPGDRPPADVVELVFNNGCAADRIGA